MWIRDRISMSPKINVCNRSHQEDDGRNHDRTTGWGAYLRFIHVPAAGPTIRWCAKMAKFYQCFYHTRFASICHIGFFGSDSCNFVAAKSALSALFEFPSASHCRCGCFLRAKHGAENYAQGDDKNSCIVNWHVRCSVGFFRGIFRCLLVSYSKINGRDLSRVLSQGLQMGVWSRVKMQVRLG
jgi:hypothetical protein